jgi:hypothetical protein
MIILDQKDKEYKCKIHGKQSRTIIFSFNGLYCPDCYEDMIIKNCCLLEEIK